MSSWWKTPVNGKTPEQYIIEHGGTTNDEQLAEELSAIVSREITISAVRQKRQQLRINKPRNGIRFVDSARPKRDKHIIVQSDNVLVISDIHANLQDAEWLGRVVDFAVRHSIETCIVAGDLIDFSDISSFTPFISSAGDSPATTDAELGAASDIVSTLLIAFEDVVILLGNHEERLARRLGNLTIDFIARLLGAKGNRARVSEYHWCIIKDSSGRLWRVTHPRNASSIPIRVASHLADKYRMNVIAAHGHDWGHTTSASGYYAAASGMTADPECIDYTMLVDNTRPLMSQGAWALVNGQPILLHPEWAKPELI